MITPLTNAFLDNPVPLQLSLNYCSHNCIYCFSNINNPKRKADLPKILSLLKNFKNRTDITSYFLQEKYPVLISNNIDPFSKNNYEISSQIIDILLHNEIPIQINTRGGFGWQEVSEKIKPSLWYVSVPYSDDEVRKQYEPQATSLDERFEMVKEIIKKHKVMIGINPFDRAFCEDHTKIIDKYREIGVKYFWVNKFHLSIKQQSNLTARQKDVIGTDLLQFAKIKDFKSKDAAIQKRIDDFLEMYRDIRDYAESVGCKVIGTPSGHYEDYQEDLYSVYEKKMPTDNDFFKWCEKNKTDGDLITFDEFFALFKPMLPEMECNISSWIYNKSNLKDKSYNKKMKLSNILHVYWDTEAGLNFAKYYPVFSWVKVQTEKKLDWLRDKDGDRVLMYHPTNYNTKDYTIIDESELPKTP